MRESIVTARDTANKTWKLVNLLVNEQIAGVSLIDAVAAAWVNTKQMHDVMSDAIVELEDQNDAKQRELNYMHESSTLLLKKSQLDDDAIGVLSNEVERLTKLLNKARKALNISNMEVSK